MRDPDSILYHSKLLVLLLGLIPCALSSQISPGDLSAAHEHLEGLSNCTLCHTLGDKVSNQKCLDCHHFLNDRVSAGLGYHASVEVRGKDCFSCHSEHHGRGFDMIRFDKEKFDHSLTGYQLQGAHKQVDCRQCHKPDNIIDYEIRELENTYLGLTSECLLCHEDYHQNTLSPKCSKCHTFESFSPASNFDHSEDADFALLGKHKGVECIDCHQVVERNGRDFQMFSGLDFMSCANCHKDVHNNRLGDNCKACHTEISFSSFTGGQGFNHNLTQFPLRGAHARIDCRSCHDTQRSYEVVFNDYSGENIEDCRTCHEDVHEGRFGTDCRQCHNENSWRLETELKEFDHDLTSFPLQGKHAGVNCKECHSYQLTEAVAHERCMDCHSDYHEGRLVSDVEIVDCKKCHTVFGFADHTFTIEDHKNTDFALDGAHLATPCFACHQEGQVWLYDDLGTHCKDCHENVHIGMMSPEYYSDKACTYCHQTDSWQKIDFDHDLTDFELVGSHAEISCGSCHTGDDNSDLPIFEDLGMECYICHDDIHRGQFSENGVTQCEKCHHPNQWSPSNFNHDSTAFPLKGAHAELDCRQCHVPELRDGELFVNYRIEEFECIDCHL
ncbi:MAG: hypothetical protein R3275_07315 [Saprospiraceae bacterium]|nr:hypothetical protein [Saprospiraceae bacterium]